MKIEWKLCLRVGISAFLLFLAIHYWEGVTGALRLLLGAAEPLILGCVVAYLLNIPMSFYEKHLFPNAKSRTAAGCRRVVCMLAAVFTLAGIIAAVIGLVLPELAASIRLLISWVPDVINQAVAFVEDSDSLAEIIPQEYLQKLESINWDEWFSKVIQFLPAGISGAVGTAVGAISSVVSSVVSFLCSVIFALYLLLSKDRLKDQTDRLMKLYLPAVWKDRIQSVCSVLNDCFHRYVVGQCTEAVILGCLCIGGMLIFRLPYATMIGTLVGFTALIPIAGAYIGAIVGTFMIFTVSPLKAVFFAVFLVILQQLEGNLIYPRVVGTSIGLPGMWVLAAVTVGGGLMGIPGMLVGVPLAAALYRLLRDDVHRRERGSRAEAFGRYRERHRRKQTQKQVQDESDRPPENRPDHKKELPGESRPDQRKKRPEEDRPDQRKKHPEEDRLDQRKKRPEENKPDQQKERPEESRSDQRKKRPEENKPDQRKELPGEDRRDQEDKLPEENEAKQKNADGKSAGRRKNYRRGKSRTPEETAPKQEDS